MVGMAQGERGVSERRAAPDVIRLTIDGREVEVPAGSTIWDAARAAVLEMGFTIRMENRDRGFMDAESRQDAYANGKSPLMNIMIHM